MIAHFHLSICLHHFAVDLKCLFITSLTSLRSISLRDNSLVLNTLSGHTHTHNTSPDRYHPLATMDSDNNNYTASTTDKSGKVVSRSLGKAGVAGNVEEAGDNVVAGYNYNYHDNYNFPDSFHMNNS